MILSARDTAFSTVPGKGVLETPSLAGGHAALVTGIQVGARPSFQRPTHVTSGRVLTLSKQEKPVHLQLVSVNIIMRLRPWQQD